MTLKSQGQAPARKAAPERIQSRLSDERVDQLLSIATEVFLEKGFDSASVGEMAKRAGASKGTYYSRYPTKELLFAAMIRRKADRLEAGLDNAVRTDRDLKTALRAFAERLLEVVLADDTIRLDRVLAMEAHRFPELGKLFYESGPGRVIDALAAFLRQKTAQGALKIPNAQFAAEQFVDLFTGILQRRAVLGIERPTPKDRRLRINSAVDLFVKAYRAGE